MRKLWWFGIVAATLLGSALRAQDLTGDWQGKLEGPNLRTALRITKGDNAAWTATFYSLDQGGLDGIVVSSLTVQGSTFKFAVRQISGSYEGTVSTDGGSMTGTWTQGKPLPLNFKRVSKEESPLRDPSPHIISFVPVQENVKLEVLDWGGTGRPLVFLAGLGNSAHVFDTFAPKFTPKYHVYGITRRGYGASSVPPVVVQNYTADRLGDDVLAVIAALKLDKPVLAGHSIAGEELSSTGTRHPEKVAGLIYLDASFAYAFFDPAQGNLLIDAIEMRRKLEQLLPGSGPQDPRQLIDELLKSSLPQLEKDLQGQQKELQVMPPPPAQPAQPPQPPSPSTAILTGQQKYINIHGPILAICAVPHNLGGMFKDNPTARAAAVASDLARTSAQASAFEAGEPQAHVVRLPNADHYVFKSNEADVLREMNAFMATLP